MLKRRFIQKALALLLTVLVLLSITPRLFLHDLVANHRHICVKNTGHDASFTEDQPMCNCTNFVAEAAFLPGSTPACTEAPVYTSSFSEALPATINTISGYQLPPRAPPAA